MPASSRQGTKVETEVAATAIALQIGCPTFLTETGREELPACAATCGSRGRLDVLGNHALGCTAVRNSRHAWFKRSTRRVLQALPRSALYSREAGCGADGEPVPADSDGRRPGDVAVRPPDQAQWWYLDHTVWGLREENARQAAEDPYHIPRAAFRKKMGDAVTAVVVAAGGRRVPVAASTYGVLDPRSARALRSLASEADRSSELAPLPGEDSPQRAIIRLAVQAVVAGGAAGVIKVRNASPGVFVGREEASYSLSQVVHMTIITTGAA